MFCVCVELRRYVIHCTAAFQHSTRLEMKKMEGGVGEKRKDSKQKEKEREKRKED